MIGIWVRLALTATSLAPVLGSITVNMFVKTGAWNWLIYGFAAGALLIVLCAGMISRISKTTQHKSVTLLEVHSRDSDVLTFLVAYLLPFATAPGNYSGIQLIGPLYIFAIIFIVVARAEAYYFNPILAIFGYRFYSVRVKGNETALLICRRALKNTEQRITAMTISESTYLMGESDV